jgi:hypothetical protein
MGWKAFREPKCRNLRLMIKDLQVLTPFHGANAGSNPAGDAKSIPYRRYVYSLLNKEDRKSCVP